MSTLRKRSRRRLLAILIPLFTVVVLVAVLFPWSVDVTITSRGWISLTLETAKVYASPDTETLRPSGVGSETALVNAEPDVDHYLNVDEAVADGHTTYVSDPSTTWHRDLYALPNSGVGEGLINSVTVHTVVYQPGWGNRHFKPSVRTNANTYDGDEVGQDASWKDGSHQWTQNPQTSSAWTWEEIDALEAGVAMMSTTGHILCTQVYVVVDHTPYTEEQTTSNSDSWLRSAGWTRGGQKLTISGRTVTKLGFWLKKTSSPSGDVTFTIRRVSNDSIIVSKVWGDASTLPTSSTYKEVTFDSPVLINEEVRILVEYSGPEYVLARWNDGDVKADENAQQYAGSYTNYANWDYAYIYTYIPSVCEEDITNLPTSNDFGTLEVGTASGTATDYFTITNNSGGAVSVTIQATDFAGGDDTWDLSDTATPGENIYGLKAGLYDGGGWISPTEFVDSESAWSSETNAYDGSTATKADTTIADPGTWGEFLELTHPSIACTSVRVFIPTIIAGVSSYADLDVYYSEAWQHVNEGDLTPNDWSTFPLGSSYEVTAARIRYKNTGGSGSMTGHVCELEFYDTYNVVVKEAAAYNTLVAGLADEATQDWGLWLYMPTTVADYDGQQMSATVTLVASCD